MLSGVQEEEWGSDEDEEAMEQMARAVGSTGQSLATGSPSARSQEVLTLLRSSGILAQSFQVGRSVRREHSRMFTPDGSVGAIQHLSPNNPNPDFGLPLNLSFDVGLRAQVVRELSSCLLDQGRDLNQVPIDLVRDVLELRQRAIIAVGNILAELPAQSLAGTSASSVGLRICG